MIPRQERQLRKRMPRLAKQMDEGGWIVKGPTGSGHIRLVHVESGRKATAPVSASRAAERNTVAWLRRIEREATSGYDVG